MFFNQSLQQRAANIILKLKAKKLKIATAESCTGGLLSALFTEISGASEVFDRAFITYSNEAKNKMLGVKKDNLTKYGAVSDVVAKEMAIGALKNSNSNIAIAITGIAGPKSDDSQKPVGLVYICACDDKGYEIVRKFNFGSGNRSQIRKDTIISALEMIEKWAI